MDILELASDSEATRVSSCRRNFGSSACATLRGSRVARDPMLVQPAFRIVSPAGQRSLSLVRR